MPVAADRIDFNAYPDAQGHFGRHGGRFVAETLIGPLDELATAYDAARVDPAFIAAFEKDLKPYGGRPSPNCRPADWPGKDVSWPNPMTWSRALLDRNTSIAPSPL